MTLTNPGIVTLDPQSFNPPLNGRRDNIYRFTTITIGPGVTVKLAGKNLQSPVVWLAEGDVRIDGIVDLDGEDSAAYSSSGVSRRPTLAGAGGYSGGAGALNGNIAQSGDGSGGGAPGAGGIFSGTKLLIPLIGGSGGGGTEDASGGGGGGALLIASSTSITLNGTISANGGNQTDPGFAVTGGSGGAIRLVAPLIMGNNAVLTAKGGAANGGASSGGYGYIRLEAFDNELRGDVNGTPLSIGKPFKLFLPPDPPPAISVISVGGKAIQSTSGSGLFEVPTATVTQTAPMIIVLEGHYVEPGSIVKVHFYSDNGRDQILESTPLTGTFALSRATITASVAGGLSHIAVDVSWDRTTQVKASAILPNHPGAHPAGIEKSQR